jgi:WD40 repeat protein
VPPRRLNASIPLDLETICLKCLEKEPGKRYASAAALRNDLGRYLAGEPIRARPVTRFERAVKWVRRRPLVAGLCAAIVLLSFTGLTAVIWQWREAVAARVEAQTQAKNASDSAAEARERLRESLIGRGRAERLAGAPSPAIQALSEAARIKPSDNLRQEAIQAVAASGVRLHREIRFGQAYVHHFSGDGAYLAVCGTHHGAPNDRGDRSQIVVYRVADGLEVDRIELGAHFALFSGRGLSFRPGATTLAFLDQRDGRSGLYLRDVAQQKDVGFLPDYHDDVYSPDGAWLIEQAGDPARLRILSADDLSEKQSWPAVRLCGFLSNDEAIVEDGPTIKGRDLRTGRETFTFAIPNGLYPDVSMTECNSGLLVLLDRAISQNASLWDMRTAKEIAKFDGVAFQQFGLRRNSPGSLLAFALKDRSGEILLYNMVQQRARGRVAGVIEAGGNFNTLQRSALSPDERLLAAYARINDSTAAPTIHVWDAEMAQKIGTLKDCKIPIWSPDGRHLATIGRSSVAWSSEGWISGDDASVKIWEVVAPVPTYRHERLIGSITLASDGRRIAVDDQLWEVVKGPGQKHLRPLPRPMTPSTDRLAFTNSGELYGARLNKDLFKEFDRPIPIWRIEPEQREIGLPTIERKGGLSYSLSGRLAAFSPDGQYVAVLGQRWVIDGKNPPSEKNPPRSFSEQVNLWSTTTPKLVDVLFKSQFSEIENEPNHPGLSMPARHGLANFGSNPRQLRFSPDSSIVAIAYNTGVVFYHVSDGKPFRRLGNSGPTHCVAFSPDNHWVCYGGEQGRLSLGTVEAPADEPRGVRTRFQGDETPQVISTDPGITWKGHEGTIFALAFSPDGRTLVTGGEDRMIRLWELPSVRPLASWEAHDTNVTALAFLDDGSFISGDAEGVLKLWDIAMIRRELAAMGLDW